MDACPQSGGSYCENCPSCTPNDSTSCSQGTANCTYPYAGLALEGYEYMRYESGGAPVWMPLRFPGQYHDEESDLFENWNRYYDPSIGRYLQPEPLMASPRYMAAMAASGIQIGPYSYAANNPQFFVDPDGLGTKAKIAALLLRLGSLFGDNAPKIQRPPQPVEEVARQRKKRLKTDKKCREQQQEGGGDPPESGTPLLSIAGLAGMLEDALNPFGDLYGELASDDTKPNYDNWQCRDLGCGRSNYR